MPILDEGLEAAEEMAAEIKANRPSAFFRLKTVAIKSDQPPVYVRPVSKRILSANTHMFMPTKDKPADFTGNWPKTIPLAICMNDRMYQLPDPEDPKKRLPEYEEGYGDCWICANYKGMIDERWGYDKSRPTYQTFGLVALREEVKDPRTKRVAGFTNKLIEVKIGDEMVKVPEFAVLAQRYEQCWHPIQASAYLPPYTFEDKDFGIKRQERDWTVTPYPTPGFGPESEDWKVYDEAIAALGIDFQQWFLDLGSQDHYDRWFVPGATPKGGYGRRDSEAEAEAEGAGTAAATSAPSHDPAEVEEYRKLLQGRGAAAIG